MAKKPNFLDAIWAKSKDKIVNTVKTLGNAGGALIGVPALGTIAGNLMDKIPVKKMAEKAVSFGKVDTTKIKETLIKNQVAPTAQNLKVATDLVKQEADNLAADPTNGLPNKAPSVDTKALSFKDKAMTFVKKYWYVVAVVVAGVIYFIFKPKSKKGRR